MDKTAQAAMGRPAQVPKDYGRPFLVETDELFHLYDAKPGSARFLRSLQTHRHLVESPGPGRAQDLILIMPKKKVFVSGCFDMLHSGHVRFLEEASALGDVYVAIGSDQNVKQLKGRFPVNNQDERKYIIQSLRFVKACCINSGWGILDFVGELKRVDPDYFIVNEDGNTPAKAELCREMGVQYRVLKRTPKGNLPVRSTPSLRRECSIPYRIDLAGGWLDQPFVSRHGAGAVLVISIEPTIEFNERSGMASSSRRRAIELWQSDIPTGDREKLAKMLFCFENPPGTKEFSGSQDALGIVLPGLNRLEYELS